jgi:Immunity protein 50
MSEEVWNFVENGTILYDALGEWPSFHDAEVISLCLDRSGPDAPVLSLKVHAFRTTARLAPDGTFLRDREIIVDLEFLQIALDRLDGFNCQNALSSIEIARQGDVRRWRVLLHGVYGVSAEFTCDRITVRSVTPK